jgi:hypothetical protein
MLGVGLLVKDSHSIFPPQSTFEPSDREVREETTQDDLLYTSNRFDFSFSF